MDSPHKTSKYKVQIIWSFKFLCTKWMNALWFQFCFNRDKGTGSSWTLDIQYNEIVAYSILWNLISKWTILKSPNSSLGCVILKESALDSERLCLTQTGWTMLNGLWNTQQSEPYSSMSQLAAPYSKFGLKLRMVPLRSDFIMYICTHLILQRLIQPAECVCGGVLVPLGTSKNNKMALLDNLST